MAERIQELCRTRRSDPQGAESWGEAMQVLAEAKEEYGERGLGLTFIYSLGMRACLDFGHPEEALRLFREVGIVYYCCIFEVQYVHIRSLPVCCLFCCAAVLPLYRCAALHGCAAGSVVSVT